MGEEKETRDQKALREVRERQYGHQVALANKKMDYLRNTINGRYYLARYNMIAEQMNLGEIKETIDGCKKTPEYMFAEAGLMKLQATTSLRNSYFAKKILIEEFKLTKEQVEEFEKDYYDSKIVQESYDDEYKKGNKAEFVAE
jgi:hypothetical protein